MNKKRKNIVNIVLIIVGIVIILCIAAAGFYIYNNLNYLNGPLNQTAKAGYEEKQVTLPDGTILNYAEGPDNGLPLFLIHGQMGMWEDYARVLPELSKHYHVFAIDCHGHGESSHDPEKYSANAMGIDFVWFIENVIGEPTVVSGHSSGGLLTVWLAANSPENVLGIVIEDAPLFSTEIGQYEKTFAWLDSFQTIHNFHQQDEEDDYVLYYLQNSVWINYFGNGKEPLINYALSYREKHPNEKLQFFFLWPSINKLFWGLEYYDLWFGETFYDASWNEGFDHSEALAKIDCPAVFIHANWEFNEEGVLMGALSGEQADRVVNLINGSELTKVSSGHDVHDEKPKEFIKIMVDFLEKIRAQ